jgi:uncharacterized protein YraI
VPPAGPDDFKVAAVEVVNVRSGPSTDYPSYGLAPQDAGWWTVELPTTISPDGIGWVNANYLITSNTENLPVTQSQYCP